MAPYSLLILLFVTLVWGTTFPLLKSASAQLSGVEISALRFALASLVVLPFAWRASRATWQAGALLGAIALVSYVAQAFGLEYISSNRSAFLTSLNVLMVPLLGWLLGQHLRWPIWLAACVACTGIGLMSWEGGGHWLGDAATLLCALAYASYVIVLSRPAAQHPAQQLAATQILVMAVLAGLWMLLWPPQLARLPTLLDRAATHWPTLIFLGVVATSGMLFLQALAQRHVSADKAALVYAMEPVFAALFGWLLLQEVLGWRAALGGALVVSGIVLAETWPRWLKQPAAAPSSP